VTDWDYRAFVRALVATLVALAVVWLVTAASDEGQLTVGSRAGRTLPLAPLCSAVGAALALGTARIQDETLALEALGRSPIENVRAAALGAALPSIIVAIAIGLVGRVDVSAFYPRASVRETFVREEGAFTSTSLGVRVADADGEPRAIESTSKEDEGLPRGARASAAISTALAGTALALVAARAVTRLSLQDRRQQRRRRASALAQLVATAIATVIAFQAAAAHVASAALAILPPALLLAAALYAARPERATAHRL
jgi:hypothetical protein